MQPLSSRRGPASWRMDSATANREREEGENPLTRDLTDRQVGEACLRLDAARPSSSGSKGPLASTGRTAGATIWFNDYVIFHFGEEDFSMSLLDWLLGNTSKEQARLEESRRRAEEFARQQAELAEERAQRIASVNSRYYSTPIDQAMQERGR